MIYVTLGNHANDELQAKLDEALAEIYEAMLFDSEFKTPYSRAKLIYKQTIYRELVFEL